MIAIATYLSLEVPAGSVAALKLTEASPFTTPEGVVIEMVGLALAVVTEIGVVAVTLPLLSST